MHRVVFTLKTKNLGPTNPVNLTLRYEGKRFILDFVSTNKGRRAAHDFPVDITAFDLVLEMVGPAFGVAKVSMLLPSGHDVPVLERRILASEANDPVREVEPLTLRKEEPISLW